ncbi:Radical S-adenosyl methionine domain-containing protein 2 [Tulasnella sp. JGI-2019a]|nr:Radical S-adenosyl methionine domain-containing protein 2 [Tulasnella sp. JGI-2019a]KAG9003205.1 Radical S-adenosyl methionine domain-containing protein 2 [Tulasnella sp. JGI-2019a]KAG9029238.1 Radical S-adenosyl methionine domain-containing protein 2 [Tulasnella sp. JGI-2019a]
MNVLRSWLPSVLVSYPTANEIVPTSVNWFPNRRCNYECDFCFHTTKSTYILPLNQGKAGLRLLVQAGMKKLNISGGEPFLNPRYIGEVFKFCKEELRLESCSVVCNGSKVTEKWMEEYGRYLDVMAISCDSFVPETNAMQGRGDKASGEKEDEEGHISGVRDVVAMCKRHGIKVKINSVVTINNWQEDMNEQISELAPFRWKVFQVLLLDGENTGSATGSLRDARHLTITKEQFRAFVDRHRSQPSLVPEDNDAMKDSYLQLDEKMRFLNCQKGGKEPGASILEVGVQEALKDSGFEQEAFIGRGGVYAWKREEQADLDW